MANSRTRSVSTAAADSVTNQSGLPNVIRSPVDSVVNGPASIAVAHSVVVAAEYPGAIVGSDIPTSMSAGP